MPEDTQATLWKNPPGQERRPLQATTSTNLSAMRVSHLVGPLAQSRLQMTVARMTYKCNQMRNARLSPSQIPN